jgi:hypothetical protein
VGASALLEGANLGKGRLLGVVLVVMRVVVIALVGAAKEAALRQRRRRHAPRANTRQPHPCHIQSEQRKREREKKKFKKKEHARAWMGCMKTTHLSPKTQNK